MAANPKTPVLVSLSIGINPEFLGPPEGFVIAGEGAAGAAGWGSQPKGRVWASRGPHPPVGVCTAHTYHSRGGVPPLGVGCGTEMTKQSRGGDEPPLPPTWRLAPRGGWMQGTVKHLSLSKILKIVSVIVENEIC